MTGSRMQWLGAWLFLFIMGPLTVEFALPCIRGDAPEWRALAVGIAGTWFWGAVVLYLLSTLM